MGVTVSPRSPWPRAFAAELNSSYSAALYGSAGRVPANLRVVWPTLLSESARLSLNGAVACHASSSRHPPNALYFGDGAIQHQQTALWVHQPGDLPFAPSGSSVEVTHCAYSGARGGDDVRPSRSPMWFHMMPGSGITVEAQDTSRGASETLPKPDVLRIGWPDASRESADIRPRPLKAHARRARLGRLSLLPPAAP